MRTRLVLGCLISVGLIAGFGCASKQTQTDEHEATHEKQEEEAADDRADADRAAAEAKTED